MRLLLKLDRIINAPDTEVKRILSSRSFPISTINNNESRLILMDKYNEFKMINDEDVPLLKDPKFRSTMILSDDELVQDLKTITTRSEAVFTKYALDKGYYTSIIGDRGYYIKTIVYCESIYCDLITEDMIDELYQHNILFKNELPLNVECDDSIILLFDKTQIKILISMDMDHSVKYSVLY